MVVNFIQIWLVVLLAFGATSLVAVSLVLVTTGRIEAMERTEKGELSQLSLLVLGSWNFVASLVLTQIIMFLE